MVDSSHVCALYLMLFLHDVEVLYRHVATALHKHQIKHFIIFQMNHNAERPQRRTWASGGRFILAFSFKIIYNTSER